MGKRYQKITPRILEHILGWGNQISKTEAWTKSDANIYDLVQREIKKMRKERYEKMKTLAANPYIDHNNPYYTT